MMAGGIGLGLLVKETVQLGAELEQTTIAFEVMTGSAEKAKNLIDDINSFANVTPFKNKDLQQNAKLMMNYGIASEDVLKNLQMLGDVAGGNSQKMNSLTLAFSQIQATGRLMGQDLLQMVSAGFNPLQIISEKTGESMGYLKDQMSKGAISSKMVTDAFKVATSEGGRFFGMMEKQSTTLNGLWSTLVGKIQTMVAEMSAAENGGLKAFVVRLIQLADKLSENRKEILKYIKLLATVGKYFLMFKTSVFLVQKALLLYNSTLKIVSTTTRLVTVLTKKATLSWKTFNTAFKSNVIGLAITVLTTLAIKIADIIKKQKEMNDLDKNKLGLDESTFEYLDKYTSWLDAQSKLVSYNNGVSTQFTKELILGQEEAKKFQEYISKMSFENLQNMGSDLERKLQQLKKDLIVKGDDPNSLFFGVADAQYNELKEKLESVQKIIDKVNKETGAGSGVNFDINPSDDLNKLTTELSTKRNIRNVTLNIAQLTGVENLNTTTIQESSEQIGRIILEELNKTTAQFAVQN